MCFLAYHSLVSSHWSVPCTIPLINEVFTSTSDVHFCVFVLVCCLHKVSSFILAQYNSLHSTILVKIYKSRKWQWFANKYPNSIFALQSSLRILIIFIWYLILKTSLKRIKAFSPKNFFNLRVLILFVV